MHEEAGASPEPQPPDPRASGSSPEEVSARTVSLSRPLVLLVLGVLCAIPFVRFATQPEVPSWGWDESMHAELPALRMLLYASRGEVGAAFDPLLGCTQYPFGYPLLLALGQGAYESGYGTSRFALEGNSFFGQWTYGGKGMQPKEKRAAKGNYGVAAYTWPLDSVRSYMMNLNTHRAYSEFTHKTG
jgi:hypothetical protein